MGWSSVGTPRFFVNVLEWGALNGIIEIDDVFRTLPINPQPVSRIDIAIPNDFLHTLGVFNDNTTDGSGAALFILGHEAKSQNALRGLWGNPYYSGAGNFNVNWECEYDGWTMATITQNFAENMEFGWIDATDGASIRTINTGSIVYSNYYTMPHSPDMKLSIDYETGTRTVETKGGASLSNTFGFPPKWGNLGQWELNRPEQETPRQNLAHKSRRIFNLSFSYLSESDMFPEYNTLNRYSNESLSEHDHNNNTVNTSATLLGSDNFISQVWNRVGNRLPFIFQPDNTVNEFAICKIVGKGLKVNQVAHKVYSISLKLREVW